MNGQHTHTSCMGMFSFNLMAIVCVIAIFLLTKNDIIVHYIKFPNLGIYHNNFPNLKGPRALPKIAKKSLLVITHSANSESQEFFPILM